MSPKARCLTTWLLLLWTCSPLTVSASEVQKSRVARTRVAIHPDKDIVSIPWAIGTPDNIITLLQPHGYTSLWASMFGAILGPDYDKKARGNRKSEIDFAFAALLPDMRPWTKETLSDFTRPGGGDKVEGLIQSAVHEGNWRKEKDFLAVYLKNRRERLIPVPEPGTAGVSLGEKPARFGLQRIGPVNLPASLDPYYWPQDLYFQGASPEGSDFFIICHAEEIRSKEDHPNSRLVAQCEHFWTMPQLSAIVKISYRRVFLNDWREIQEKVGKLLTSFLPENREVP